MNESQGSEDVVREDTFTVGQLLSETPGFRRIAYCTRCQERVELPVSRLVEIHGAAAPLGKALGEIACPRCSALAINVTLTRLG